LSVIQSCFVYAHILVFNVFGRTHETYGLARQPDYWRPDKRYTTVFVCYISQVKQTYQTLWIRGQKA